MPLADEELHHFTAAQGYAELGMWLDANAELEELDPFVRPMPEVLAVLTVIIELGAGLLLVIGWKARWAAFLLFLFVIPVSLVYHNFWTMEGAQAAMNKIQFMKNVSIMGGMLLAAAFGPGRYSVDKG